MTIINIYGGKSLDKQADVIILERTKELGNTLCLLLLTFGLRGIAACTREEAFQVLQDYPGIHFGIIDIDNTATEGLPFIRGIRQKERFKHMKIIVHTAQKIQKIQKILIPLNVLSSITKPFDKRKTFYQLKKILNGIYFTGTEKRRHIRIKPEPDELARVQFIIKFYPHLIFGKILDVSIGGMAVELLKSPPRAYIKKGMQVPQILFSLDYKQVTASGKIQLQRGKIIIIHFNPLSMKAKTIIARYIFKRISES
jgi:CheY-like chemotaxis protein